MVPQAHLFKQTNGLKGKVLIEIIGVWLPFGLTGGKEVFSLLLTSKVCEEIM